MAADAEAPGTLSLENYLRLPGGFCDDDFFFVGAFDALGLSELRDFAGFKDACFCFAVFEGIGVVRAFDAIT
jgi:hypothetical protein